MNCFTMSHELRAVYSMDKHIAEKILSFASSLKADAAEVFLRAYTSTTVEVKGQKVDAFDRAKDIGAGLRVLVGMRMGFAFTTDLSNDALRRCNLHNNAQARSFHHPEAGDINPFAMFAWSERKMTGSC
jgi:predicted Zn-dependent protease